MDSSHSSVMYQETMRFMSKATPPTANAPILLSQESVKAMKKRRPKRHYPCQDTRVTPMFEERRQIHIQNEQKRRAQIKEGFEELRNELPPCLNKKMSKVALLHRTVQHIQHLKTTQLTMLAEIERLMNENEQLQRFQASALESQQHQESHMAVCPF